jgi:tRNA pseudouridine38-40 synthase
VSKCQSVKVKTIQETIEEVLCKILQEKIKLIASGRTDAGVHAQAQVANFKTDSDITFNKLARALNGLLPEDIVVSKAEEAPLNFHSRFSAKSKVYRYTILNRKNPSAFLRDTVYFYPFSLNIKLMQRESRALLGRHNFKSFQASDNIERNPVRKIKKLKITKEKKLIYIDIEADGFLYNMVRNIIGTLMEIGRRRLSPGSLRKILSSQNRKYAGPTAPADGLCLLKVKY